MRLRLSGNAGGAHALLDRADYQSVSRWKWHLHSQGYACRNSGPQTFLLARQILGLTADDPREVLFRNGNRLDCRRANLLAVPAGKPQQSIRRTGGTSKHRGVGWDKARGKWHAKARLDYKMVDLGRFTEEAEAAAVMAEWRAENMPYSQEGLG